MLTSMGGCSIVWIGVTSSAATFSQSGEMNTAAARATIACIFMCVVDSTLDL